MSIIARHWWIVPVAVTVLGAVAAVLLLVYGPRAEGWKQIAPVISVGLWLLASAFAVGMCVGKVWL